MQALGVNLKEYSCVQPHVFQAIYLLLNAFPSVSFRSNGVISGLSDGYLSSAPVDFLWADLSWMCNSSTSKPMCGWQLRNKLRFMGSERGALHWLPRRSFSSLRFVHPRSGFLHPTLLERDLLQRTHTHGNYVVT
jgi:hypothetical protein